MKAYAELEVELHSFLTSILDGGGGYVSYLCHFILWERGSDTDWTVGSVGPTASLDVLEKREICSHWQELNNSFSVVQLVT